MRRCSQGLTGSYAQSQQPYGKVMPISPLSVCRKQERVEASLADSAADIVAGEQRVALTGVDRSQLDSLLQMESNRVDSAQTSTGEAQPARPKRTSIRPGTRKLKRDAVGE